MSPVNKTKSYNTLQMNHVTQIICFAYVHDFEISRQVQSLLVFLAYINYVNIAPHFVIDIVVLRLHGLRIRSARGTVPWHNDPWLPRMVIMNKGKKEICSALSTI